MCCGKPAKDDIRVGQFVARHVFVVLTHGRCVSIERAVLAVDDFVELFGRHVRMRDLGQPVRNHAISVRQREVDEERHPHNRSQRWR